MMLVNIRYYKPLHKAYAGNAFTYRTAMPLTVGDKVMAPTKGGDKRAACAIWILSPASSCGRADHAAAEGDHGL